MTFDDRFSWGFVLEVIDVLERHGYHCFDNQHTGQAVAVIGDLAQVYDGTRDIPYGTYGSPTPTVEPGPVAPDADDAVILTHAEASTVATALDIAADYKRARVEACAKCTDQSCRTCQGQLTDARTYGHLAAQMLQTAQAARTANQPTPSEPPLPSLVQAAGDKEAGQ